MFSQQMTPGLQLFPKDNLSTGLTWPSFLTKKLPFYFKLSGCREKMRCKKLDRKTGISALVAGAISI
jgi:hypothetical protein